MLRYDRERSSRFSGPSFAAEGPHPGPEATNTALQGVKAGKAERSEGGSLHRRRMELARAGDQTMPWTQAGSAAVVVAQQFNPSIITQLWLVGNRLLAAD